MHTTSKFVSPIVWSVMIPCLATVTLAHPGHEHAESIGLDGYCPVCITEMQEWVKGSPDHKVVYDGRAYLFPGEKQAAMFRANPAKYVPVLGGDCVVCLAKMKQRVAGSVQYAALYQGRIYLFPGDKQKQMFLGDPDAFARVDLALDGNCAVCLVEMNKQMPGNPQFTAIHEGLRYQFPGQKQLDMFVANPDKYKVQAIGQQNTGATGIPEKIQTVSLVGTSACAACDYGKQPLGSDTLGLAVDSDNGKVYIIEDVHRLYPAIYERRFDGLVVKVTGRVIKQEGRFVWVQPQAVSQLN